MKKIVRTTLLSIMFVASLTLVACGNKETNEEATNENATSTTYEVESTTNENTSEDSSTNEVESTTNEVEESTTKEVTTEETTTKVEKPSTTIEEATTSKVEVETTTKVPEPTTQAPIEKPIETPTKAPSNTSASIEKIKSLHIAYRPAESNMLLDVELSNQTGSWVFVPGPNYREMADYVDTNCSGPNPYKMHEWTTRKYWGDKDEVTVGYYCYQEDIDNMYDSNGLYQTMAKEFLDVYDELDGCHIKIGTYEGKDIYFEYFFLSNPNNDGVIDTVQ